jgi:CheY-like chemotaxis protein
MDPVRIKTIMVVDDSEIVLEVVRSSLEAAGYRVITRNRPVGCLALMLKEEPDLVLVDVSMPEVGGDTLVRCFGTAHPTSTTIVLLHSGLPEEALKEKARLSGAHGYIRKTSNQTGFVREIAQWLRRSSHRTSAEHRATSSSSDALNSVQPKAESPGISGTRAVPNVVLLVDSDMLSLSQYRKQLQGADLTFEFALSSAHALGRLTGDSPPDLVVSNAMIGDVSGAKLFERAIAHSARWRDKFIFFGDRSDGDALDLNSSFRGPMLSKPVQIEDLKNAIRSIVGSQQLASGAR